MRERKRLTKRVKIIIAAVVFVVAVALGFGVHYLVRFSNYERDVAAIQVQAVDLGNIADGEYYGDCDVDFVAARVRVVIKNHQIVEIELVEHYNDRGEAASVLPQIMVEQQRVDVDAISGATSSSKVIQEAVYNALTGAHTISD